MDKRPFLCSGKQLWASKPIQGVVLHLKTWACISEIIPLFVWSTFTWSFGQALSQIPKLKEQLMWQSRHWLSLTYNYVMFYWKKLYLYFLAIRCTYSERPLQPRQTISALITILLIRFHYLDCLSQTFIVVNYTFQNHPSVDILYCCSQGSVPGNPVDEKICR